MSEHDNDSQAHNRLSVVLTLLFSHRASAVSRWQEADTTQGQHRGWAEGPCPRHQRITIVTQNMFLFTTRLK